MTTNTRLKNIVWNIHPRSDGAYTFGAAQLAVLMDIRDELLELNGLLHCPNFVGIPPMLDEIVINTRPKRRTTATKRRKVKK